VTGREEGVRECWRVIASYVATEEDPDKLVAMVSELNRLLDRIEERMTKVTGNSHRGAADGSK